MTKVNPFKEIENTSIKYPECLEYLKGYTESEILEAVDSVLGYIDTAHKYSMSRLYALWNFIFDRSETPQSCSSCLIRKSHDLREWMKKEVKAYNERENYDKSPNTKTDVLGDSEDLVEKDKHETKKTTRGKRKEA